MTSLTDRINTTLGWRTMETAPKNGTEILLYGTCRDIEDNSAYAADRNVGWWSVDHWAVRNPAEYCEPTHWMPLPPAPFGDGK